MTASVLDDLKGSPQNPKFKEIYLSFGRLFRTKVLALLHNHVLNDSPFLHTYKYPTAGARVRQHEAPDTISKEALTPGVLQVQRPYLRVSASFNDGPRALHMFHSSTGPGLSMHTYVHIFIHTQANIHTHTHILITLGSRPWLSNSYTHEHIHSRTDTCLHTPTSLPTLSKPVRDDINSN